MHKPGSKLGGLESTLGTTLRRCDPAVWPRVSAILLTVAVIGCAGTHAVQAPPSAAPAPLLAEAWPEAEAPFKSDAHWLGGDGALSIALDRERTLWLFGDSFVVDESVPRGERTGRAGSVIVRNSIALQVGADLATASLKFHARPDAHGRPSAFFVDGGDDQVWLWPGHGLRVGERVLVFMHRMRADASEGGLGFVPAGHIVLAISHLDRPPPEWQVERVALPELPSAGLVGTAVLRDGAYVYAFGVRDPGDRALTLVRWSAERFEQADLAAPEVWTGPEAGFVREGRAAALLAPVATELSVTPDARTGGFVLLHSQGFGVAPIEVRFARALTGPWSAPSVVDLAPYVAQPGSGSTLVYAAKAHAEQQGAEWVVTYAVNSLEPTRLWTDLSIYFPRVLRLRRAQRRRDAVNARRGRRSRAWPCPSAPARARPARSRTTCAARASQPAHP